MKIEQNKPQEQPKTLIQATQKRSVRSLEKPILRFSPTAWAKLLYFRDKSDNEVGGFGITKSDDLLFVQDFVTVKQEVTCVSVKFDDNAVADFFDSQVDLGRRPEQFARIWLHTHPGDSSTPSIIDEETFAKVFGNCQWAVMFVLAQNNTTHSRLRFNIGPGGESLIPVAVDYSCEFDPANHQLWDAEFKANVKEVSFSTLTENKHTETTEILGHFGNGYTRPFDFLDELERLDPTERQFVLDELSDRPDLWDEESEAMFL